MWAYHSSLPPPHRCSSLTAQGYISTIITSGSCIVSNAGATSWKTIKFRTANSCHRALLKCNAKLKEAFFKLWIYELKSGWHHLRLNLSKTELLFILGKDCPRMDLSGCRGCHGIAFIDSEEPRHKGRRTVLHPQHHCCGLILQICPLQHPQDPDFPHKRCCATPGPSTGHLPPGLLQLPLGWTLSFCN